MRKSLSSILSVAVLFAFGLCAQAQDKATTVSPQEDVADSQASLSDQVLVPDEVDPVAPVAPVEQGADAAPPVVVGTSDCLGCGQSASVVQGCSACGSTSSMMAGCATPCCPTSKCCATKATACASPSITSNLPSPATSCGCTGDCGNTVSQVSYVQPIVTSDCNSCGNGAPSYVASCDTCPPTRTRSRRGIFFRNR